MATIELVIPVDKEARVIHALCVSGGFAVENAANAREALINHLKKVVWRVETQEAEAAVAVAVDDGLVESV
jgi:hypothetical protein